MNWKSAYLESRILSASPLELVNILYEHAIMEVRDARHNLETGDVRARCRNISKAIAILSELESSLDLDAGGEIAVNLARLYRYMRDRLLAGNMQQAAGPMTEVLGLLEELASAWRTINTTQTNAGKPAVWASVMPELNEAAPASMAGWMA